MMKVSFFSDYTSTKPVEKSLDEVVQMIRSDARLSSITTAYRAMPSKGLKSKSPLFAVACRFSGGKGMDDISDITGLSLVDVDHVENEKPNENENPNLNEDENGTLRYEDENENLNDNETLRYEGCELARGESNLFELYRAGAGSTEGQNDNGNLRPKRKLEVLMRQVCDDPHTLLCYRTISGDGLRIIFRYEVEDGDLKQQKEFYKRVFLAGNNYYAQLLNVKIDEKCKNVTRLSGLAYDPDVYYNTEAEPFSRQWIEEQAKEILQRERTEKKRRRELKRLQHCYETIIRPEVEAEGAVYAPGHHNDYVMRVGYRLNQFGFRQDVAEEWARTTFSDYENAASVVTSCYKRTEEFATRGGQKRSRYGAGDDFASVEDIQAFLTEHIRLRYNEITGRVEYCHTDD